jgi:tetratricopeptide (TPR) repeat protein
VKNIRNKLLIIIGIVLGGLAVIVGIRAVLPGTPRPEELPHQKLVALNSQATVSDRQFQVIQNAIERAPADPKGYNLLCAAYMKKAKETGDFGFNARAETALDRSFELNSSADNYDAIRLKAMLLLVYHRFGEALEVARRAREIQPLDPQNYGAMTDALIELGDYPGAFNTAQAMMDIKPSASSYSRVSYLRELQGDTQGAIELMRAAAEATGDPETAAWCRVHLGDLLINSGKAAAADHEIDNALNIFPDYYLALAAKARVRLAVGDLDSAVGFYKQAQERVPLPETAIALGDLYTKQGRADEAKRQYELVEFIERAGSVESKTYSRNIALFWADHDVKLDEALTVARRERELRSDIYTSDALAWCLYKKGQLTEAKTAIDEALRLGTQDARLFYHAGMIEQALGNRRNAVKYLQLALKINPSFDILQAEVARQTLRAIAA